MKQSRSVRLIALAAAAYLPAAFAAELPVYDATQVAFGSYTVVKRVWADNWRSAFSMPGERELADARRAVIDQAARAGADAVVNLTCMSRTDSLFNARGYYCYGEAIKAKR